MNTNYFEGNPLGVRTPLTAACPKIKNTSVLSITPVKDQAPGPNADSGMSLAVCTPLFPGTCPVTMNLPSVSRAVGSTG